ncbi:hypothetical protein N7451_003535, partial [Penicillium sp. IBT 35674x]
SLETCPQRITKRLLSSSSERWIKSHWSDVVVKLGRIRLHEAPTLAFIAQNTTIPVPKAYWVSWGKTAKPSHLYARPTTRLSMGTLNTNQKASITDELGSYLNQLRALKGVHFGAINLGETIIGPNPSRQGGSFQSEQAFNESLLRGIISLAPWTLHGYAKRTLTNNHETTLTHFYFTPWNILVEGGRVTAVLGWVYAGWYPECWE